MNYELALKLKEAGFPQTNDKDITAYWSPGGDLRISGSLIDQEEDGSLILASDCGKFDVKRPTLKELIEECANEFESLSLIIDGGIDGKEKLWWATARDMAKNQVAGETAEEAVAYLWIRLNKKG